MFRFSQRGLRWARRGDKLKGTLKEGVGKVTDDKKLEREGKLDQAKGKAKDALADVKDALKT